MGWVELGNWVSSLAPLGSGLYPWARSISLLHTADGDHFVFMDLQSLKASFLIRQLASPVCASAHRLV